MSNLPVPFKSQWDTDASKTRNDCGPCAIAMILGFYGLNVSTDDVFSHTEASDGLITVAQLQKAISSYGFRSEFIANTSTDKIKELLDKGIPPIALVHYGTLVSRQDKTFNGGHFFTIVGYHEGGFFVNDPDFFGQFRADGDHHNYTTQEFTGAWSDCHLDGNPDNTLLVIYPNPVPVSVSTPPSKEQVLSYDQLQALQILQDTLPTLKKVDGAPLGGNLEGLTNLLLKDAYPALVAAQRLAVNPPTPNVRVPDFNTGPISPLPQSNTDVVSVPKSVLSWLMGLFIRQQSS